MADLPWHLVLDDIGKRSETLKRKTNADCIRAMTDEELAEMFLTHDEQLYRHCPRDTFAEYCQAKPCKACWLDWLRQEAEEG